MSNYGDKGRAYSMKSLFDNRGVVKTAPQQGRQPVHRRKGRTNLMNDQRIIDFCLNCPKPDCPYGDCKEFRDFVKVIADGKR